METGGDEDAVKVETKEGEEKRKGGAEDNRENGQEKVSNLLKVQELPNIFCVILYCLFFVDNYLFPHFMLFVVST